MRSAGSVVDRRSLMYGNACTVRGQQMAGRIGKEIREMIGEDKVGAHVRDMSIENREHHEGKDR